MKKALWWGGLSTATLLALLGVAFTAGLVWFAAAASRQHPLDLTHYAPRLSAFLAGHGVKVEFGQIEAFYDKAPVLRLSHVGVYGADGELAAYAEQVAVRLSLTGLLWLGVTPKTIEARGVTLRLVRQPVTGDGQLGAGVVTIAGFAPPARTAEEDSEGLVSWLQDLRASATWWRLKHVRIERLNLLLRDEIQQTEWLLEDAKLQASRYEDEGEDATAVATLRRLYGATPAPRGAERPIPVLVKLQRPFGSPDVAVRARLGGVDFAMVEDYLPPRLQGLLAAQGEVAVGASLGRGNILSQPWLDLNLKNVRLQPPEGFSAPLLFPAMQFTATYAPSPTDALTVHRLVARAQRGNVWRGAAQVWGLTGTPVVSATLASPGGDVQGVFDFFPDQSRGFRKTLPWLRQNISGTTYTSLTATWRANLADYPHCKDRCGLNIAANMHGGQVKFLDELPPVNVPPSASFVWVDHGFEVLAPTAVLGNQQGRNVRVRFDDIFSPSPTRLTVRAQLSGTLMGLKLDLASVQNLSLPGVLSGTHLTDLQVQLPFYASRPSEFSDATLTVASTLGRATVGQIQGLPAAFALQAPKAQFGIVSNTLRLVASGTVAGLPLQVDWAQPLKLSPTDVPLTTLSLVGQLPGALLQEIVGIPTSNSLLAATLSGPVQLAANVQEKAPRAWAFGAEINLVASRLQAPTVNLLKPAGEPLRLTLQGASNWWQPNLWQPGQALSGSLVLARVQAVGPQAQGGGRVAWHPEWRQSTASLNLTRLAGTQGVMLGLASGVVSLTGQAFDLRGHDVFADEPVAAERPLDPDLTLNLNLKRLLMAQGTLTDVQGTLSRQQGAWQPTTFRANLAGGGGIRLTQTGPERRQVLRVKIDDLGQTLRTLGAYENLRGGKLLGEVTYTSPPGAPKVGEGRLTLTDFELQRMPTLVRLLSLISLEQLLAGTDSVLFTKAAFPVRQNGAEILVKNAILEGPSMSLRLTGSYNQAQSTLSLGGQLAPAIPFNRLVTKIPLLGTLLSGSQNGVVVADFTLTGPAANPEISVQPLSLVTPGLIKDLFGGLTAPRD